MLESRDQLDSADDSYDLLGTDDRQLCQTPPVHPCDNIVNGGIFLDTNRLWGHDCRNAKRTHSLARGPALLDSEERLKPVYGWRTDAQLVPMQEISLRHDPYETSIIVHNGKASLIGLQQQARGVFGFTVANEVRITSVASMVFGLLPSPPSHSLFD